MAIKINLSNLNLKEHSASDNSMVITSIGGIVQADLYNVFTFLNSVFTSGLTDEAIGEGALCCVESGKLITTRLR